MRDLSTPVAASAVKPREGIYLRASLRTSWAARRPVSAAPFMYPW